MFENEQGQLHREDGPAIIADGGSMHWYRNGNLHREDGPAAIDVGFSHQWYYCGHLHREDGPAIEYEDGRKFYYIKSCELTEEEFNLFGNS